MTRSESLDVRWTLRARAFLRRLRRSRRNISSSDVDTAPIVTSVSARIVVGGALLTYIGLLSWWTLRNHWGFGTFGFDIGIFDQGLWLLSRFDRAFVTVLGLDLFGDHTSFILLPLVPLYWVFDSASVLLVAQSVALGLGALPVFLIGRSWLRSEGLAAGFSIAYLLHPALMWTNYENFHPDSFEVPLVLFAFLFIIRKRWTAFFVCLALLLSVKEDVALLTIPLGVYIALAHNRKIGIITTAVSTVWFVLAVWVILPSINGVGSLDQFRIPFGGMTGLLKSAVTEPWDVARYALSDDRSWYLWQLFAPLAFISILGWRVAIVSIGPLLSNVLSTFWYQFHIQYHYSTLVLPVLVIAAVYAFAMFRSRTLRMGGVAVVIAAAATSSFLWGPAPWARVPAPLGDPASELAVAARDAIDQVPDGSSVSASPGLVPHLSHRREIYEFPNPWWATNWGDFSLDGQRLPMADSVQYVVISKDLSPENESVLNDIRSEFTIDYENAAFLVLRRSA